MKALLDGHFVLRSGKHSACYLQSALFLSDPVRAARAGEALAALLEPERPEIVLSPATGGLIIGHETARALGVRSLFAERKNDRFELRRGFALRRGMRVAVVEDIITTGGSVRLVLETVERAGAECVAVGCLIDRSEGARFPVPFHAIATLSLPVYEADACPLCRAGTPVDAPGSRGLSAG
ncbi:MAG: orotate phosphoribosyltransferase [Gemmatimonadetes bacterium]|nr:orotate phosphoribosyltransferase [Gemmatimonadota bacterium]